MVRVTKLQNYADARGNVIEYGGTADPTVKIRFTGSNNRLVVADDAKLGSLALDFDCNKGLVRIGGNVDAPALRVAIRVGQDSSVLIGSNVSSTTTCYLSATEGTTITVGDDVMFASDNELRADDGHPIFDVRTGKRVNVSKSITVGNHVWLGRSAVVLAGGRVGDGSVVGYRSVVTSHIPNNCIAVGVPARVLRRDIAWERPHLSLTKPYYKPDASTVAKSDYWHLTSEISTVRKRRLTPARIRRALIARGRRFTRRRPSPG